MKLRPYQSEAIDSVWHYFAQGNTGNPVIALPTGTGKSLVIGGFIDAIYRCYPTQRVMMLTHVKELIEQNFDKLLKVWPMAPAGIYSAGVGRKDTNSKIIFAGIQSAVNQVAAFGHIDLLIIDECHLVSPSNNTTYRKFIDALLQTNPYLKVVGLTATPYRLGLGLITEGGIFTDFCYDRTQLEDFNYFINEGYLCKLIPKRTSVEIDVSDVKLVAGEFNNTQLQDASAKYEVTYKALTETANVAYKRKKWLIFTTGVDHCYQVQEILDMIGITSEVIHGGLGKKKREAILEAYDNHEFQALINNNVLTTGFDSPYIDCIVMLRPTNSPGLWVQMLGRGTRTVYAPGYDLNTAQGRLDAIAASCKQDCLVMDFAGNTKRLGPINDPIIPKAKGNKGGVAPVRICDTCGTYLHSSIRICTECGYEFPQTIKFGAHAGTDELIALPEEIKIEVFKVTKVIYTRKKKRDRPDSVQVDYYCGLRRFREFVCPDHPGFAGKKGREWINKFALEGSDIFGTDLLLENTDKLKTPTHVRVWMKKPYPEVKDHSFDGGF